jgi:hypothetical protein
VIRLAIIAAIASLAGCGSGVVAAPTSADHSAQTAASKCPCIYVANDNGTSIGVYAGSAHGRARPIRQIKGSRTKLQNPFGVAADANGNIYVANAAGKHADNHGSVTVYGPNASGNAKPMRTIGGSNTGLDKPSGIALNPVNGDIYVVNEDGGPSGVGSVTIYAPGATGNVAPIGSIAGESTGLSFNEQTGIAFDTTGNLYVPNVDSVLVFAADATGNVPPIRTIRGNYTLLEGAMETALDPSGNLYVGNLNNSILVFSAGANGNVAPTRDISGPNTKLDFIGGLAIDGAGNAYAASYDTRTITEYAVGATGDIKPINTIKGHALDGPLGISIR